MSLQGIVLLAERTLFVFHSGVKMVSGLRSSWKECSAMAYESIDALHALQDFFKRNLCAVETWFNTISPRGRGILELKAELLTLASKRWDEILA
jgi:hypothetical protein